MIIYLMENGRKVNSLHPPPRPKILAGMGGPIKNPNKNDVLSGRGGGVNGHCGNQRYRILVNSMKTEYLDPRTRKMEKTHFAAKVVRTVRQSTPPGRFLKLDPDTGMWHEIGDKAACRKTGQALRENSSEFRSCWRKTLALAEAEDDERKLQAESAKKPEA